MKSRGDKFGLVVMLVLLMSLSAIGQNVVHPTSLVEVVRVTRDAVEIRIHKKEVYPINVEVGEVNVKAMWLNAFGYEWQKATLNGWSALTAKPPEGPFFGDVPPRNLVIGAGATANFSVSFRAQYWDVKSGMKLRLVVKTWHSVPDKGMTEVSVVSSPFIWREPIGSQ